MSDLPVRRAYPKDVSDQEWRFVVGYLCLLPQECGQRRHPLREVFNALRYVVWAGCPWRGLPHDLPPWKVVYQQSQRWIKAGVFEALGHDLRALVQLTQGREAAPSAVILDGRTVQSTPESGARADYDGHKRKNGSKTHVAVDTLGHLLTLHVTPANAQEREQVDALAAAVQAVTGEHVQLAWVDQGYTGPQAAQAAAEHGTHLSVIKLAEAKRGFVLLPRRWVVERTFGWIARCRRLARDYERLPATFAGLHWIMFAGLLLGRLHFQFLTNSRSSTTCGAMYRAVLEGMAFEALAIADAMEADAGLQCCRHVVTIGGALQNPLLAQLKADAYNVPVKVSPVRKATSLGAALLAGMGSGVFADAAAAVKAAHRDEIHYQPDLENSERLQTRYKEVCRGLYSHLRALHHQMHLPTEGV